MRTTDKTEQLRCDIVNNAPLPSIHPKPVTFCDLKAITILDEEGFVRNVEHYEVGVGDTLVIVLK